MRAAVPFLSLWLGAAAVQWWMVEASRIHWNSDQAVVGIMARDILTLHAHPVFYYGVAYAGSLEPHWVALVFALLGSTVTAYRIAMVVMLEIALLLVYRIARAHLGRPSALIALAYLAFPPFFFLYKGLTSDGAYDAVLITGALVLYASLGLEAALRQGSRQIVAWMAALGAAAGLGWWVDPLIVYFYAAVALWFVIVRPSILRNLTFYVVFAATFVLGGFPWWIDNIRRSWHSIIAPELGAAGHGQFVSQFQQFWTDGLPIVLASRPVLQRMASFPGEIAVAAVLFLVPIGVALGFILRNRLSLRTEASVGEGAQARFLLLVVLTVLVIPIIACMSQRSDLVEPRYLFPLYVVFPLLFGFALSRLFRGGGPADWPGSRSHRSPPCPALEE